MKITLSIEHGSKIYRDIHHIDDEDFSRYRYPLDFLVSNAGIMMRNIAKEMEDGPRKNN